MKQPCHDLFLMRIHEIESSLDKGLYISALALALTLPDICGKAEYPTDRTGTRYKKWYSNHVEPLYQFSDSSYSKDLPYLNSEVVYSLRNNFLHTGNPNIDKQRINETDCQIDHFELRLGKSLDGDICSVAYGKMMVPVERTYQVNVYLLCIRLCRVAKEFYLANKDKFDFFQYHLDIEDS